jgi:hypothetical protein
MAALLTYHIDDSSEEGNTLLLRMPIIVGIKNEIDDKLTTVWAGLHQLNDRYVFCD